MANPKYPNVIAHIREENNPFVQMMAVYNAMADAGASKEERDAFFDEALTERPENIVSVAERWVTVS